MKLTLQTFVDNDWVDAAILTIRDRSLGAASPCDLGYEMDYVLKWPEAVADPE